MSGEENREVAPAPAEVVEPVATTSQAANVGPAQQPLAAATGTFDNPYMRTGSIDSTSLAWPVPNNLGCATTPSSLNSSFVSYDTEIEDIRDLVLVDDDTTLATPLSVRAPARLGAATVNRDRSVSPHRPPLQSHSTPMIKNFCSALNN